MKKAKFMVSICAAALAAVCLSFSASAADEIAIDETNFPDEAFRSYISENFDTDKNGSLSEKEINNAEKLVIDEVIYDEDDKAITPQLDLTGINYLKNLKTINICSRNVINADISGIEALTSIGFSGGDVSGLVLGDMSSLEDCFISRSDLRELSLVGCRKLLNATIENNSNLTKLEIKDATCLSFLSCSDNALASLKAEDCDNLEMIQCQNNRLTKLDITDCPRLNTLNCSGNIISELDITPFEDLIENLENYEGLPSQGEPPLVVDSNTKVIGYDMPQNGSPESTPSAAESTESAVSSESQGNDSNTTLLIIIMAVIVIAGIAGAVIVTVAKGGKEK